MQIKKRSRHSWYVLLACLLLAPAWFPFANERVAVLDQEEDGNISIALYETSGIPVWRETMSRRTAKMSVAR